MMEQFEKVVKGLECCIMRDPDDHQRCGECPYNHHEISNTPCANGLKADALSLIRQQQERIGELEKYRRLQVHNIGNVDIPDGVTMEQFCEIMDGVIKALEHTEKGESWPYKPPKEEERGT